MRPSSILSLPEPFDELSVHCTQPYRGHRVNAVEDQVYPFLRTRRFRANVMRLQHNRVAPIDLMHPPERSLIPVQVGIRDDASCHQIGVYATWHFGLIGPWNPS